jgi:hypothetical protein
MAALLQLEAQHLQSVRPVTDVAGMHACRTIDSSQLSICMRNLVATALKGKVVQAIASVVHAMLQYRAATPAPCCALHAALLSI